MLSSRSTWRDSRSWPLKNSDNILPLNPKSHERIAVIGPNADNRPMMWGNYNGTPTHTIDILDGLRSHYKNLVYIKGCDLTADKVIEPLFNQCRDGKTTGLKGSSGITPNERVSLSQRNIIHSLSP